MASWVGSDRCATLQKSIEVSLSKSNESAGWL
jgi:hypothetical protein